MTTPGRRDPSREPFRTGPLSGMGVRLQWITVLAVVLAAGTGLRSLYLELIAPPPTRTVIVERPTATPLGQSATEPVWEPIVGQASDQPDYVAMPPPVRAVAPPSRAPEPSMPAVPAETVQTIPAYPTPPEQIVHYVRFGEKPTLEERLRSRLGPVDEPELAEPSTAEWASDDGATVTQPESRADAYDEAAGSDAGEDPTEPVELRAPGPSGSVGGVVVSSLRWNGRELEAEVREDGTIGATLVTVRGLGGSMPSRSGHPSHGADTAQKTTSSDQGVYYFRVFLGSTDVQFDPDSHGLLGSDLRVLPSREVELWDIRRASRGLLESFDLCSSVWLDALWIPAEGERGQVEFVAAAAGKLYQVETAGAPTTFDGWHEMSVRISRRFPGHRTSAGIELTALIERDRLAVLGVPDSMLTGVASPHRSSRFETTFVALTPQFNQTYGLVRILESRLDESPSGSLIAIEGPQPVIPVDLLSDRALGGVRLRVLVSSDGEPRSVFAIETTTPRDEYLIEPVVSAVRKWRFHPPALDPGTFGGYFEITVAHDGEIMTALRVDNSRD